ncbi:hypothetical protein CHS0354_008214 [Potamilus streckersoni]|uniref:Mediator complex subunit Med25 PTOV domain-containing protein n=1 Tax=Potamilus streckersoni TaxID=2493646 RepID=A0AAE0RWV8_9BIVA|nr:hypothetical protein CHS0354_008214 [Potamilus streckersoni]
MERLQLNMIQKHQSQQQQQQQQPQVSQPPVSMMSQYGQPQMSQMSSSANEMDLFSDPILPIHPSAPKTLGMGQQVVNSHQGQIQQHSGMGPQPTSGYQGIPVSQQSQMSQVPISAGQFQGQMLPGNQPPGGLGGIQQQIGQPQQQQNIVGDPNRPHQLSDRKIIWRGQLEWQEKSKTVGPNSKITRSLGCMVSISQTDPDINASSWPGTLIMQLMPQALLNSPKLNPLFKNSRQVAFHFHQTNSNLDALKNLYRVMGTGFAGCVHFPTGTMCEVRVLLLLFSTRRKAFVGLIPNDQAAVVNGIREVITLQKQRQQAKIIGQFGHQPQPVTMATTSGYLALTQQRLEKSILLLRCWCVGKGWKRAYYCSDAGVWAKAGKEYIAAQVLMFGQRLEKRILLLRFWSLGKGWKRGLYCSDSGVWAKVEKSILLLRFWCLGKGWKRGFYCSDSGLWAKAGKEHITAQMLVFGQRLEKRILLLRFWSLGKGWKRGFYCSDSGVWAEIGNVVGVL